MRQNKTSNKRKTRSTYIYYCLDGTKYELKPGVEGVTEAIISTLHREDDDAFNAQRREDYHVPARYNAYHDSAYHDNAYHDKTGESVDRNTYLADESTNPETLLTKALSRSEQNSLFKKTWEHLQPQQQELIFKKLAGLSNVDIAMAEGVSEAAIRNRLKKIQAKFKELR